MSGPGFDLEVTLTAEKVTASAVYPGAQSPPPETGSPDTSLRTTIDVLQEWLGRWGLFSTLAQREFLASEFEKFGWAVDFAGLPVPETFRVLGEHLYHLAFPGPVDELFGRARAAAQRAGASLRVVLRIEDASDPQNWLAALPWEFVYHPKEEFFLAAEDQLVLSRFLEHRGRREPMRRSDPPLKVLFLNTVPDRPALIELSRAVWRLSSEVKRRKEDVLWTTCIEGWNESEIRTELARHDVVHVAGVCRAGAGGRMEIELPDVARGESERRLVSVLTGCPPRLVVLHLLEANPFDYAATFGGHARALAGHEVPAVLAMQYPLPLRSAEPFAKAFYHALTGADPVPVDVAVQSARRDFREKAGDDERLIGAPVLYLQTSDGMLVDAELKERPGEAETGAASAPGGGQGSGRFKDRVAEDLHGIVRRTLDNPRSREILAGWLDGTTWTGMRRQDAVQAVRRQMLEDSGIGLHEPAYTEMIMYLLDQGDHLGT